MQTHALLSRALIIGLAASFALAGCKKKEDTSEMAPPPATEPAATTPPPATAPAPTVTVSSVTVGNTAAADKSVAPMATLGGKDKIIVSVRTDGTANGANLAVRLTFQDGQVAGEQSRLVAAGAGADLEHGGALVGRVARQQLHRQRPLGVGQPRLDLLDFVDGQFLELGLGSGIVG